MHSSALSKPKHRSSPALPSRLVLCAWALAAGTAAAATSAEAPPSPAEGSPRAAAASPAGDADRLVTATERAAAAAERLAAAAARIAEAVEGTSARSPAATPAVAPPEHWRGTVGLGFSFLAGNAESLTLTGTGAFDRKWTTWSASIRASGAYGISNPTAGVAGGTSQTTARRASVTARGDRAFGTFASLFVLGGGEFDHVKNVEARGFGELGTGLTLLNQQLGDLEQLFLRVDLALRSGYETRVQYFPRFEKISPYGIVLFAPRCAATFRWAPSKDVRLSEELELIPFVLPGSAGRVLINNTTKLSARLTERVSLTTALVLNFDSSPPQAPAPTPAKRSTDVAVTAGIEASF